MSRDLPRRPSSRNPTSRPRRVAGQAGARPPDDHQVEPALVEPALVEPAEIPETADRPEAPPVDKIDTVETSEPDEGTEPPPVAPAEAPAERRGMAALFDSRRVTVVLVVLVLLLGGGGGALLGYQALHDDEESSGTSSPVVISGDDATDAVAAAATSAETIVATSYEDYDEQVDEATKLMTDAFAKEYRQTAGDIKEGFVAAKTAIQVRVTAQGVVKASRTEVQALVFLDQYTSKDAGDTTYTPFRVLVTVVHTDRGWLVSGLDTK